LVDVGHVARPQSSLLTSVRLLLRPFSSNETTMAVVVVHLGCVLVRGIFGVWEATYIVNGGCTFKIPMGVFF
jgi:hypothetical protein